MVVAEHPARGESCFLTGVRARLALRPCMARNLFDGPEAEKVSIGGVAFNTTEGQRSISLAAVNRSTGAALDVHRPDQPHFRDGHWPEGRRRCRAGSGRRRRPELRPRQDRGRPVDQSGSRAACRRCSRSPVHLCRRTRGQPPRPRAFARKVLGTSPASDATGDFVSTGGTRVAVEISAVPLKNGERVVGVFGLIEGRPDDTPTASHPHLTPRQVEVLRLLSQGHSTKQIAAELHLSTETVRNHIRRLFRALGVHSRLEAVAAARAASPY